MTSVELEINDLKEKVKKIYVNKKLDTEQQEKTKKLLEREKDFFTQTISNITFIKQNPYRTALSIKDFY
ncbi:6488_t:CDS:2 [Cetraspora pellucida]|uniref:6488_t:CDS:1 n=1 Tax=Cetraspora pellucida TaxID=1433469 RepID=A0A9N9DQ21_9GLOM|nr:6488_t:CDS:2 [Cetraspora pellucida]